MNKIIPYVLLGYPCIRESVQMIKEMASKKYIPYIEIGMPSMNPYHDGEVISEAQQKNEIESIEEYFDVIESNFTRKETRKFICMGYFEDIERFGQKDFISVFKDNGLAGLIVVGRKTAFSPEFKNSNVPVIPIISKGFETDELKESLSVKQPFIYFITGEGRTGEVEHFEGAELKESILKIREIDGKTDIYAGFGVDCLEKANQMKKLGFDGVIIGSAIVKKSKNMEDVMNFLQNIGSE